MRIKSKLLSIVLAGFLTFAVAGQAAAYYEMGSLVLTLYAEPSGDKTDNEVGLHLLDEGSVPTSNITTTTKIYLPSLDVTLTDFNTTSDWADVNAGVWGASGMTNDKWVATANNDFGAYDISSATQIYQTSWQTGIAYDAADANIDGKAVIPTTNSNSYDVMFNSNSVVAGYYASFNAYPNTQIGEANLADLDILGYVDMYLWYSNTSTAFDTISAPIGIVRLGIDDVGGIDTFYAELRPVPLPGALVLLGSGLLGLVGIRRRSLNS